MDLTRPGDLKKLLEAHGLRLTRRFGQHFLVDRNHLEKVVTAADLSGDDATFEIGPGVGTLTVELAKRAGRVVAVELDRGIFPVLEESVRPYSNVTVVQGDALKLDLTSFLTEHWGVGVRGKVVANIPYNITSPLLVKLLEASALFTSITLMVQKEVADRLRAEPDSEDYGSLTVFVRYYATLSVVSVVPRGAFFPPPKVDSAVLHLVPHTTPPVEVPSSEALFMVSRAAFGQRRKTLLNALSNAHLTRPDGSPLDRERIASTLESLHMDPQRRGETLGLPELAALTRALFG